MKSTIIILGKQVLIPDAEKENMHEICAQIHFEMFGPQEEAGGAD